MRWEWAKSCSPKIPFSITWLLTFWRPLTERFKNQDRPKAREWSPDLGLSSGWAQGVALPVQTGLAASAVVGPSSRTWLHITLQSELKNNLEEKNHSHCQHRPYAISCKQYPPIWYWRLLYPLWINLRLCQRETIHYPETRWVLRYEVHNEFGRRACFNMV